ncbi:hypothetical protein AALH30_10000 [Blautia pseudococcoides]|uniref:hypothetical protein n=1 Tax=Blautia pseudococcoides TaxID=1796616 RepID=UPI00148B028D|nr:hypothetical protein [Blautia pseudococcoides]QJU16327.1 hypothetical protein HL650_18900 [Blautia pseudococcoides]
MKKRSLRNNKNGSGLIIAIAIMAVLMMLSLALLLVSFSLYSTARRQQDSAQCRELAQSLSKELEYEITIPSTEAYKSGAAEKYPLWFYLRFNVWQNSWKYFNNDERGHMAVYAYRHFNVGFTANLNKELTDGMSVLMYWISEDEVSDKNGTQLVVSVTSEKGKAKTTITSYFELNVTDSKELPKEDEDDYDALSGGQEFEKKNIDPDGNTIDEGEIWSWELSERE